MSANRFGSKQSYEAYYVVFAFKEYLGAATIVSAAVTAVDVADDTNATSSVTDSTKQVLTNDEQGVKVWVKGGTSGHSYKVTCCIVASDGSLYELDGILPVKNE